MRVKAEVEPSQAQQQAARMNELPRLRRTPQPPREILVERDVYGAKVIRRENLRK